MSEVKKKAFPKPLRFRQLIGPSFLILALGLGSGEIILWPYLVSNYGLGIAWGALLGITFQYFINMEIERYALVKGESVFVGLKKQFSWAPKWFIFSTFAGFGIPGIIAACAVVVTHLVGFGHFKWYAIAMLLLIGVILSLGKTVYDSMEKIAESVIMFGTPFILILAIYLASKMDWAALGRGLIGIGEPLATSPAGYWFLPAGISIATFLAAFAYAGAGGNLNLTQSIYVREKGYGMGKYATKMAGLFRSKQEQEISLEGVESDTTPQSVENFKLWWKQISKEHLLVFWFIGILTMSLLMLLSYTTVFKGTQIELTGIDFVIAEGLAIGQALAPWVGVLFLIVVSIKLFQTQLGVMDSTSRIMSENLALDRGLKKVNLSKIYFSFVWAQIIFGIILFLLDFTQPITLLVLGAVINALGMFVHIGMVNYMNIKQLPKPFRAKIWREAVMLLIFLFFAFFSGVTVWTQLGRVF